MMGASLDYLERTGRLLFDMMATKKWMCPCPEETEASTSKAFFMVVSRHNQSLEYSQDQTHYKHANV